MALGFVGPRDYSFPKSPEPVLSLQTSKGELAHDLLQGMSSATRKEYPVKTGFMDYFRDAIFRVANVSYVGNQQHNAGQPTHWARGKSADHGDCLARHMLCNDDEEHMAQTAWRAMADLQMFLEKKYSINPPPGAR